MFSKCLRFHKNLLLVTPSKRNILVNDNKFLWNQLELKTLSDAGFQTFIILNNYKKNLDTEWIKYCWLESEKKKNCTVIGLLPLLSSALQNESLNKITVIWDKLKPRLLN